MVKQTEHQALYSDIVGRRDACAMGDVLIHRASYVILLDPRCPFAIPVNSISLESQPNKGCKYVEPSIGQNWRLVYHTASGNKNFIIFYLHIVFFKQISTHRTRIFYIFQKSQQLHYSQQDMCTRTILH